MDQINALKGYGKVTNLELEAQIPPPSKTPNHKSLRLTAAAIAAVIAAILLTIILIHNSTAKQPHNSPNTIQIVCNVTRNPSSCVASITSLNPPPNPDPKQILNLSLQLSLNELTNLSRSLKTLAAADDDDGGGAALKDCESQIEDAIGLVGDSMDGGEAALTERRIGDVQTWMSSAMTEQESCLDGLQETDAASFREVKAMMAKSVECVSNSLAIVANFHVILAEFNMSLH